MNCRRAPTRVSCASSSAVSSPRRVAALVPSSTVAILLNTASIFDSSSGVRLSMRGRALTEGLERGAILRQLVSQLRGGRVRLVEFRDVGAELLELLARLLQRLVLRLRAAAHLVDLRQPFAQRFEGALLARHFVGLRHQRLERLAELVGALVHDRELLVLLQHAFHARFGFGHLARQRAQPVIELIEFLLVDGEAFDRRLQVLRQPAAVLLQARELARPFFASGRRGRELRGGVLRQLLHARHGVFGAATSACCLRAASRSARPSTTPSR